MYCTPLRSKRTLLSGVALAALSLGMSVSLATNATAQNSQLAPTFGTFTESEGFGSFSLTIQAGGDIDASGVAPGCNGFIADAPDIVFDYSGQASVFIEGNANVDTTMLVEAPDGQIICNDDFNELNPGMQTAFGEPGRYAVWIGTYEPIQNNTFPDADIVVTEAAVNPPPVTPTQGVAGTGFDAQAAPGFGEISVTRGFGQQTFTLQAGGAVDAFATNSACAGFVAEVPDYVINYSDNSAALDIAVASTQDTTLVVVGPDGTIYCNDDDIDLNPALSIANPEGGNYAVWVGTFSPIENDFYPDASLTIATGPGNTPPTVPGVTPPASGGGFDVSGTPTFGRISLSDLAAGHSITLQAGGNMDAFNANNACAGYVADTPDYVIDYAGGRGPMTIASTSEVDTTLVVVGPDGTVYCNDDAVDLNPAVTINSASAGAYSIFVGTFSPIENDFYPDTVLSVSGTSGTTTAPSNGILDRARLAPAFGSVSLRSGFAPHNVDIQAGGFEDASAFGNFCNGFVADAPDYVVGFGGGDNLRITATSDDDTTMVVVTPSGEVLCNDDFNGLNPGLITNDGAAGDYAIWIGTFGAIQGDAYPTASLLVEEISANKVQPSGAITSVNLTAGFTPDPFTTTLAAGGVVDASTVDGFCYGNIAAQPDFVLNYTSGDWPLRVFVDSAADTTLLMRTPSGEVLCNDDADGLNPALSIATPVSGLYEIFIGTYASAGDYPDATLAITELLDDKVLPDGALTETNLGFGTTWQDFDLLAGGSFEAFSTFGGNCNGFVAGNPDFITFVEDAGVDVEMTVRSAEDTTLVVRGPNGQVTCDDDSGGDLNPLVLLSGAQAGTYEVWLGTFGTAGNAPATLSVRDANADAGTVPNVPGGGKK
ncbi:MAG: hypothetical protein AB8B88_03345 [Devosiaceae bacterium]